MIQVYTTPESVETIQSVIREEFRLSELVTVSDFLSKKPENSYHVLLVNSRGISFPIDWYNLAPPYVLPESVPLSKAALLGLIYFKLDNFEKAGEWLANEGSLLAELDFLIRMKQAIEADPEILSVASYSEHDDYRLMHNHAIVRHYATDQADTHPDRIEYFYTMALEQAPNEDYQAYTLKHFASFLIDVGRSREAEKLIRTALAGGSSADSKTELKALLIQIGLQKLTVPYDQALLTELKAMLSELLGVYERQGREIETGMVFEDAAHLANVSGNFAEALSYMTKAIDIYRKEPVDEEKSLYYNAQWKKGKLLYTWARSGQPQFYKAAMDAYVEALKLFRRDYSPEIFAEIQHHLGVIYAEIPDEARKKSIWAAVSSSAFQEALNIFSKENHPYDYAMVCNSYGNALTKYPEAVHSDNFEKALYYYNEALEIRTAAHHPYERALTLLNYLEASWYADNSQNESNPRRLSDMEAKAAEVLALTVQEDLVTEAHKHIEKLRQLKLALQH